MTMLRLFFHQAFQWMKGDGDHDIEVDCLVFRIKGHPVAFLVTSAVCTKCGKEWS
jgi:hypothetical protein